MWEREREWEKQPLNVYRIVWQSVKAVVRCHFYVVLLTHTKMNKCSFLFSFERIIWFRLLFTSHMKKITIFSVLHRKQFTYFRKFKFNFRTTLNRVNLFVDIAGFFLLTSVEWMTNIYWCHWCNFVYI